jgi:hypothetical protein
VEAEKIVVEVVAGVWELVELALPGGLKLPIVVAEVRGELEEAVEAEILSIGVVEAVKILEAEIL